jgi:regulatory protein
VTTEADPEEVARLILLRHLTRGPRTRSQLAEACAKRGVPGEVADRVLDRFTELGLVDDEEFAHAWVQSRHSGRGLSRKALRFELRRRGVDDDTIDGALSQIHADDELEAARALARSRAPGLARYDLPTRQRRLAGLLGRRGYSPALAASVVREVLGEQHGDDFWP